MGPSDLWAFLTFFAWASWAESAIRVWRGVEGSKVMVLSSSKLSVPHKKSRICAVTITAGGPVKYP